MAQDNQVNQVNQSGPGGLGDPGEAFDADAFNAFEAAGWQRKATGYAGFLGAVTSRLAGPLLDAAGVGAGMRVLDVATGPGYCAAAAAEAGASVVGVDVAPAMVALARQRNPGLDFRAAQAEALPFADGSFDAVVGNFAILHLGRPEVAAAEFARVLRPGGRLALTTWDLPAAARLFGVFLDAIAAAQTAPPASAPAGPSFFRYSVDERFAALLRDRGLAEVEVRTLGFGCHVGNSDELWNGLLGGSVRLSALIESQTDETRSRVRAAFDRLVAEHQRGDTVELPVSVKLASGRKVLR